MTLPLIYLAGGISSRFGGRIKALAPVGPNNEPFLAVSMDQAIQAGFDSFILIVSDKTKEALYNTFGDSYRSCPIAYAEQVTPEHRQRPFGTSHALLSAKNHITGPFALASSDDLFGVSALKSIADHLKHSPHPYCTAGYRLRQVLPPTGKVNRAILEHTDHQLTKIVENLDITSAHIGERFSGDEFAAMLIYGFDKDVIDHIERDFSSFLEQHGTDPRKEILLPDSLNNIIKKGTTIAVLPTEEKPLYLTFPEDEKIVRSALISRDR